MGTRSNRSLAGALAFLATLWMGSTALGQTETEPEPDDTEQTNTELTGTEQTDAPPASSDAGRTGAPTDDAQPLAEEGPDYEPDQRGEHDGPDTPDGHEGASEPIVARPTLLLGMRTESVATAADDARFFGFDLQLWLGGGLTAIEALHHDNLVRANQQGGFGASVGLSAGLRMGPISVGPRATLTVDPSFMLITVGADVRAVLSDDELAPTVRASLSGVFLTELSDALPSQTGAGGVHAELGVGVRWRFFERFTFGAELAGGYLHLDRQPEASCTGACEGDGLDLRQPGSSDGLTLRLHLSVGYRF